MRVPQWEPPVQLTEEEVIRISDEVLAKPDIPVDVYDDIFRISVLEMDWDIACEVFRPTDLSLVPRGADGKKIGIFLLHGGMSDHRYMRPVAGLLSKKYGCKVVSMSFPGRCYLLNETHDCRGHYQSDRTVRTPHWCRTPNHSGTV